MPRRQICPGQWLIVDRQPADELRRAISALPRGSGVLLLRRPDPHGQRWLWHAANRRSLVFLVEEQRTARRVHDQRELTRALLKRSGLILISPIWPTSSHPDWKPLPRMRAAALARLARRKAIALGGMNQERYAKIARLGFIGWAGISAFRT